MTREERKVKSPGGKMMDRMKAATRCFGGKMVGKIEGANKEQDDDEEDDKKQVERQGNVNMRQDGDGRDWATDVWKNGEGEKRGEMGKGGQRVNLEYFFRRYKQAPGEQQQQQQGGRDEKYGCCEQGQEIDWDERRNWTRQGNQKRSRER